MKKYRYCNYPRRTYSDSYKVLLKFMKVVPDYMPKYNALLDNPACHSEEWLLTEMKALIDAAEKEKKILAE